MPVGTPAIKHLNVARLGGHVILAGDDFDSAKAEARLLEERQGLTRASRKGSKLNQSGISSRHRFTLFQKSTLCCCGATDTVI